MEISNAQTFYNEIVQRQKIIMEIIRKPTCDNQRRALSKEFGDNIILVKHILKFMEYQSSPTYSSSFLSSK